MYKYRIDGGEVYTAEPLSDDDLEKVAMAMRKRINELKENMQENHIAAIDISGEFVSYGGGDGKNP